MFKAATYANLRGNLIFNNDDDDDAQSTGLSRLRGSRQESLDEPDYTLCSPRIPIFSFEEQNWFIVNIKDLKKVEWKRNPFDSVELPEKEKALLQSLGAVHATEQERRSRDFIDDKGRGLILLFYGPSGVGKTLTAGLCDSVARRSLLTGT
jgi:hypothetical protein